MSRFVEYLKEHNIVFPGTESTFYDFLVAQQIKEVKASRLQGALEALRFVKHVMDVPELEELIASRRCNGAARIATVLGVSLDSDLYCVLRV